MLRVILYDGEVKAFSDDFDGTVIVGRQDTEKDEPPPFKRLKLDSDTWKVVFATSQEKEWSRNQVVFSPTETIGKIKVTNGGKDRQIQIVDGPKVPPGKWCEVQIPVVIGLDRSKVIRVQAVSALGGGLPNVTLPPMSPREAPQYLPSLAGLPPGIDQTELIDWLNAATDVLQAAVNSDEFFDRAAAAAIQMVDLDSARLLLHQANDWHPQAVKQATDRAVEIRKPSQRVLNQMLREKRTIWEVLDGEQDGKSLHGVDTVIAAPVLDRDGCVIGALYGERQRALSMMGSTITEAEAMLVELLARGVAAGLARQKQERAAVALQSELEIGRHIQKGFLPVSLPAFANWEIDAKFEPAREVSGDFYDSFTLSDIHVGLVVADVCNKGVGAALFMALFRSLIRAFSQQGLARDLTGYLMNRQREPSPHGDRNMATLLMELNALTTVARTNNYVATMHADAVMFATIFFGILDTSTGIVHYVNAGHDPPYHLGPSGIKGKLEPTGPAVGWQEDQTFVLKTVQLEPGDMLFCYTDGLTDARSPAGASFKDRVEELMKQPFSSAAQILNLVEKTVHEHTGGGPPFDDLTLLAVYRATSAGQG